MKRRSFKESIRDAVASIRRALPLGMGGVGPGRLALEGALGGASEHRASSTPVSLHRERASSGRATG